MAMVAWWRVAWPAASRTSAGASGHGVPSSNLVLTLANAKSSSNTGKGKDPETRCASHPPSSPIHAVSMPQTARDMGFGLSQRGIP